MKKSLQTALDARGYTSLTPVQQAVSDPELGTADLLVSAQTGSGKTVGFGIAIAPAILGEDEQFGAPGAPLALIIAPTRELALQVRRELGWLYAEAGAVMASCVGGMDARTERRALERGAHILVATPGRLCDHLRRGSVDLSAVRAVVLDEADEMLDMGFREDLEAILEAAPADRQTLLFSATVPPEIERLAQRYQRDAKRIVTQVKGEQHSDIDYRALTVSQGDEENAITNLLRYYEAPNAILFANTRATVARLVSRLSNRGFSVVALSGELSQAERSHALQAMRDGRVRICVATDVAARGIDLPNLDLVIHAELPLSSEALLHRSGRTGRAGRKGISALIVPLKLRKKAERLLKYAKLDATWDTAPTREAILEKDEARFLSDSVWTDPAEESDEAQIARVLEKYSPEAVAGAMIRLWRGQRSAPEELSSVSATPRKPEAFGPSRWFSISVGRIANANPRWILPKVCKAGGIDRDSIGAIRIGPEESYIEIKAADAEGFLEALGPSMEVESGLVMAEIDEVPEEILRARPAPRGPKPHRKGDRPFGDRMDRERKPFDRKPSERKSFDRPAEDRKPADAPSAEAAPKERKAYDGPDGEAHKERKPSDRKVFGRGGDSRPMGRKSSSDRKVFDRPDGERKSDRKPSDRKPTDRKPDWKGGERRKPEGKTGGSGKFFRPERAERSEGGERRGPGGFKGKRGPSEGGFGKPKAKGKFSDGPSKARKPRKS